MSDSPIELMRSTLAGFQIAPDVKTISNIQDIRAQIQSFREKELEESQTKFKVLSRKLEISTQAMESLKQTAESSQHAEEILSREKEKFRIAKLLNITENEIMSLESQLQKMKEQLLQLEERENTSEDICQSEENANMLKLNFYHSLGFDLETAENTGNKRVIIHTENDLQTVQISNKYSPYFYSNYFWDLLDDSNDKK
ncbi:Kinetochore protein spc24 [Schizosaccharomyces pombe]